MKNRYLICLKDEVSDTNQGVWSIDTSEKPGEFMSKFGVMLSWLPDYWGIHIIQLNTPDVTLLNTPLIKSERMITIVKSILDVLKLHRKTERK